MAWLIFIAVVIAAIVGFQALDRWHQRYARRNARRQAERFMRMRRGEPPL